MRVNSALAPFRYSRRTGTLAKRSVTIDARALRGGDRFDRAGRLSVRDDARTDLLAGCPRVQLEIRDGRDRRQSFAAKAERCNRLEILRARELAGRMAPHG